MATWEDEEFRWSRLCDNFLFELCRCSCSELFEAGVWGCWGCWAIVAVVAADAATVGSGNTTPGIKNNKLNTDLESRLFQYKAGQNLNFLQKLFWKMFQKWLNSNSSVVAAVSGNTTPEINKKKFLPKLFWVIFQKSKHSKGQLISKCPFGVKTSSKNLTKYFPGFLS